MVCISWRNKVFVIGGVSGGYNFGMGIIILECVVVVFSVVVCGGMFKWFVYVSIV